MRSKHNLSLILFLFHFFFFRSFVLHRHSVEASWLSCHYLIIAVLFPFAKLVFCVFAPFVALPRLASSCFVCVTKQFSNFSNFHIMNYEETAQTIGILWIWCASKTQDEYVMHSYGRKNWRLINIYCNVFVARLHLMVAKRIANWKSIRWCVAIISSSSDHRDDSNGK